MTLIFDLDGTLLDTISDLAAAGNYVCRERGWRTRTVEEFKLMVGHGMENLMTQFSPPEAHDPEHIAETLRMFNSYYDLHSADLTKPYPGITELIDELHAKFEQDGKTPQFTLAVYSNKADEFAVPLIERFFPQRFALIQGKREGIPTKPNPKGLLSILERLKSGRENTLFVGDSATDVNTGHNAGIKVCAVTWGYRSRESIEKAKPDFIAEDVKSLREIIFETQFTAH